MSDYGYIRDPQEERPIAHCDCCGGEIYSFDSYYDIDGDIVCPDCLLEYAEREFAKYLVKGGEDA